MYSQKESGSVPSVDPPCQSVAVADRVCARFPPERREGPLFPAKLLVALPMAGRIWSLLAKSQSQVRGAESRAERAHGAFLGQSLQDPIVYKVDIRV